MKPKTIDLITKMLKAHISEIEDRVLNSARNFGKNAHNETLESYKESCDALDDFYEWKEEREVQ